MKKILIIKMSSLGDVIHTLPALSDVSKHEPGIQFDWVVEPGFAEIPKWHHSVNKVIPAPLRNWRKNTIQAFKSKQIANFIKEIRSESYDLIIDPQGLLKSSIIGLMTKGPVAGYDQKSIREPWASWFYNKKYSVAKSLHAVERIRYLFASIFGYNKPHNLPDYGVVIDNLPKQLERDNYVVFLHGTTWRTKHWPLKYWYQLAATTVNSGVNVLLPFGNEIERQRAEKIRSFCKLQNCNILPEVLPKLSLSELAYILHKSLAVIAVDTGLGHVAAAIDAATISLFGPTDPNLTGAYSKEQVHLYSSLNCAPCFKRNCPIAKKSKIFPPCFESVGPNMVWQKMQQVLNQRMVQKVADGHY